MNQIAKLEPETLVPAAANPMEMIDRAVQSGADITVLERLMALQERWELNQHRAEFSAAKAAAMAEMPSIPKTGENKHQKTKYSTLADIVGTTRPVLADHGLTLSHTVDVSDNTITVTAVLAHANGYSEVTSLPLPFDKGAGRNAVQAIGSSQTYGQRYTAQAILGLSMVAEGDDDGSRAGAGKTITADQYTALCDKIERTGADEAKMVTFFKIDHLGDLPLSKYDTADAMLDQKLAAKGGANG